LLALAAALGLFAALTPTVRRPLLARAGFPPPDRRYWDNGRLRWEGRGAPGAEHGRWTAWYPNGNPRERGTYENGARVGAWLQWHSNGQRASFGERAFDPATASSPRQGEWTFWHENGDVAAHGRYERGLREGAWEFWRPDPNGGPPLRDPERSGTYAAGRRRAAGPEGEGRQR